MTKRLAASKEICDCTLFATELGTGFDSAAHHINVEGKTCYVYELTAQESGETHETLYF